jgi:colicin import membrane protein
MQLWRDVAADREEEGKITTAVQSLVLIGLFFFLFFVQFSWHFSLPQSVIQVSLVPTPIAQPLRQKPTIEAEPQPEPEPKIEPQPQKPTEADIALEKKREEELKRKEEEEKDRRKKEEEQQRKEKKREEELKRKKKEEEKDRRKKEEEQRKEEERKRQAEATQKKAELSARREELENLSNIYVGRIISSIDPYLITPASAQDVDNLVVVVEVLLDSGGELLGIPMVVESSGLPQYDEEAVRAVMKAAPLPLPKERELLEEFKKLRLHISPE